jgi:hypothetical protein
LRILTLCLKKKKLRKAEWRNKRHETKNRKQNGSVNPITPTISTHKGRKHKSKEKLSA